MRKMMVFVIALSMAAVMLLSGCGEIKGTNGKENAPTATPQQTMRPEDVMPDPNDGVVRDDDGIITDGDTGNVAGNTEKPILPETSKRPDAGTAGTTGGTASAKR